MKKTPFFLLMFFVFSTAIGQVNLTENQRKKLDSIASQDVPNDAPGIATAIISDGKLIYVRYTGFENLEDSLKIDKDSRFNIASNGKQFTALAILLLEEQGKLNLQDDIRKYIPEIYKDQEDKITIQNRLNHTSGIRDVYDLLSLKGITWWQHTYDNQDVLDLVKAQSDLNFSPGSRYLYSNTNYIILAEIIERVTEKSFVQNTNELFAKLNMNNTSFEDDHTSIQGPIAVPYFNFDTWSNYEWKWNVVGDGNVFSTLQDQIDWEKIVQGKGNPQISRELINKSQKLENTSNFRYGYGLEFDKYKNLPYRFHEGATGAWKATIVRFQNKDLSIITLTNS
jgi:CubicO group peptidase (beta-lactamase class C family)